MASEIKQILKNSIYKNPTYSKNKYNFIEFFVVMRSKKPFVSLICIFLIMAAVFLLCSFFKDKIVYIYNYEIIYKFVELIFNAQVTMIALIFPLVVGFVGIFIKDDFASNTLLRIYKKYSGFALLGYSSLLFIFTFTVLQYFLAHISNSYKIIIMLCFVAYFIINLLLLIWFVYATIVFIDIDKRNKTILKHVISIVLIEEFKKRYKTKEIEDEESFDENLKLIFNNIQNSLKTTISENFRNHKLIYLNL